MIKRQIDSQTGAASILILINMVVLIIIAGFSFMSANTNYKFSQNALTWSQGYYILDSLGEKYLMDIDIKLKTAEKNTIDYMINAGYTYAAYEGVDSFVQSELNKISENASSSEAAVKAISQRIYMYYAGLGIEELSSDYPNNIITALKLDGLVESISTEINFSLKEGVDNEITNENYYLKIKLNVMPFRYNVTYEMPVTNITLNNKRLRYRINSWEQWSTPIELITD